MKHAMPSSSPVPSNPHGQPPPPAAPPPAPAAAPAAAQSSSTRSIHPLKMQNPTAGKPAYPPPSSSAPHTGSPSLAHRDKPPASPLSRYPFPATAAQPLHDRYPQPPIPPPSEKPRSDRPHSRE